MTVVYALRRAALACSCLAAVLVAASLFPAAGFGSYPGTDGGPSTLPAGDGAERPQGPPATGTRATETPTPTMTDPGDAPTVTTAPDPGPTPTPTPLPPSDESDPPDDGGGDSEESALLGLVTGGLVTGFVLLLVVVTPERHRRRLPLLRYLPGPYPSVRVRLKSIPQATLSAVVGVSAAVPALADRFGSVGGAVTATLRGGLTGTARVGGTTLRALGRGTAGIGSGLARGLGSIPSGLGELLGGLRNRRLRDRPGGDAPTEDGRTESAVTPEEGESDPPTWPADIESSWDGLTDVVRMRNASSRTPAEVAREAVDAGLPRTAVRDLTRVFREVTYGARERTEERTQRARAAIARVLTAREDDR